MPRRTNDDDLQQKVLDEADERLQTYPFVYAVGESQQVSEPTHYVNIFGLEGARLLCQMIWRQHRSYRSEFWHDDWMPYSNSEITKDTGLSRRQQLTGRKRLEASISCCGPVLTHITGGQNNQTFYKVNLTALDCYLREHFRDREI